MPAVLLIEYIWHLEEEMEQILENEYDCEYDDLNEDPDEYDDLNEDPDEWLMDKVLLRAVRLWKGEQVDGSALQWKIHRELKDIEPVEILSDLSRPL